jgi:N-acyl-D-amino-acid deacylase
MYPYEAAASGLDAAMPPWVQEGGHDAWIDRLRQPDVRARVIREIAAPEGGWQNLYRAAGSADRVLLLGFRNPRLACYQGLTLAQIAQARGRGPEETIVDLVVEDHSRVNAAYFLMSEDNVRRQLALPWIALCSDAESLAPSAAFAAQHPHPRAYGAFARFLGHYSRDLELVSLPRAIQRITALPAANLGIAGRGALRVGNFADVVVFDPERIADHATYAAPHRFASGVQHVYVNGVAALRDGTPTRARPGRVVRGPGWAAAHERPAALELPRAAG